MNQISSALEKHRKLILDAERYIWQNPETGYKEVKTSAYMAEQFEKLGYSLSYAEGITGFVTVLDTGRLGPEVMILGELDSVICPAHPEADPITGAVHSCGHNAQCAALLGIAAALKEPGMLDGLCGRIRLCAVPAEELLEISYRTELKKEGKIKYFGGKTEFLHRGLFDGVDLAFMVHTGGQLYLRKGAVGLVAKKIIYKGRASHAGGSPHLGCNALYAATCGLNAVNALRETFRESDLIRFHPIVTKGGDMVNAIPETAEIETYVRGATFDAITKVNRSVNRALIGAALSMGANVEIVDSPGYAPECNSEGMNDLAEEAAKIALPHRTCTRSDAIGTGSTDMGDLSCIMPTVQPHCGGATGMAHGNNYQISDPEQACVESALWQLTMLRMLLENGAARAFRILENFVPQYTKEEFLALQDSLNDCGDRIEYGTDEAKIRL